MTPQIKKVLLVLCIAVASTLQAQDFNNKFAFTTYNSTYAWMQGDGANIGFNLQYQHPNFYAGPDVFYYPDLRGYTYLHVIGTAGVSFNIKNQFKEPIVRVFAGFRAGTIRRGGTGHGLLGGEVGLQFNITQQFFAGGRFAYDQCGDSKVWSNDDYQIRKSGYVELGFRF